MSFVRSSPALRAIARNTLPPRLTARSISRSRPLRADATKGNTTGPKDGSSDMPWIIGAVAFTAPACYYLLAAGSPRPQHSDPHAPMDTASTSPGDNVQTEHEGKRGPLTSPDADTASGDDQATEKDESEGSDAVETTVHATEQAEETVGETQGKDQETATELKQETGGAAEEAKDKVTGDNSAAGHGPETHPAVADAKRDPNTTNEMSGKQEGVSNADTAHATFGGGAISKKGEGMHDTSKLKGTVDVNRPSK